MSRQPVRVLIADDHPIFREGLRFLLDSLEWAHVVGEAETGVQAVEKAAALQPDVVAMDLQLPGLHGIEATRRILAANPKTRVLVLTMSDDDDSVFAAMRAGALGYLVKGATPAEVAGAIQAVASGEAIFGPAIARRVIDFFAAGSAPRPLPELTDRGHGWFSAATALAFLAGGADMARTGFFAPHGGYGFLLFWLLPLWLLVTGTGLLRRPPAARATAAAPGQIATPAR